LLLAVSLAGLANSPRLGHNSTKACVCGWKTRLGGIMAKAKSCYRTRLDGLETSTCDDKEPGKREMHVIATHTMRERMPNATLGLTGAGRRGVASTVLQRGTSLFWRLRWLCVQVRRALTGSRSSWASLDVPWKHAMANTTDRRSSLLRQPRLGPGPLRLRVTKAQITPAHPPPIHAAHGRNRHVLLPWRLAGAPYK
jgi:hypothetical protein